MSETNILYLAIAASVLGIIYAVILIVGILKQPAGSGKMIEIASAIQMGAKSYLSRQYKTVAVLAVVLIAVMFFIELSLNTIYGFVIGAVLSALAGFIGMHISVRSNVRTAEAAKHGLKPALSLSFKGGAVTGLIVASLGLLSVAVFYLLTKDLSALAGLAFGASLISVLHV